MFDKWLKLPAHYYLNITALSLLIVGVSLSNVLMSIGTIWIIANWLLELDFKIKLERFKTNTTVITISSFFVLMVISLIWSSNLDAEEHLTLIVKAAIEGDFIVALEALTLIENLETINNESIIIESMILINEYLSEKDDDKIDLIKSMLDVLKHFEAQLQLN